VSKIVEPNIDNRRNADALGMLGIAITLIIVGAGAWSLDGARPSPDSIAKNCATISLLVGLFLVVRISVFHSPRIVN
jgi:hypothetical protein